MGERGKVRHVLAGSCLACVVFFADAQSLNDHLAKGDRFYQKKDYENALKSYEEALELDANDPETNFKAGIAYLNKGNFSQAVMCLEKAHQLKADVDPDIDYHLGMAYKEDHQFNKARGHFETFKQRNKKLAAVTNQKILECIQGDSIMRIPQNAHVQPLPGPINTPFAEFAPLISDDGGKLIFTSSRSSDNYQVKSSTNFGDVYISRKNGAGWSAPEKISSNINVRSDEAAISISDDGRTLFLYYEDGSGDIYTSNLEGGEWTRPVALNRFINHPQFRESSACVSADGKRLYFSSSRPGGKGGFDIYVCEMGVNGQWGRPANLGSTINTRLDEDSPFLHSDGKTLYFSSNGHLGLGQKDIFKSRIENNKWTLPENLGYPINTSGNEGYFILRADTGSGYLSSQRGGIAASPDIYSVTFSAPDHPFPDKPITNADSAGAASKNVRIVTLLKGRVIDVADSKPLEATISLVDNKDKVTVATITTGPSGNFELVIPQGGNYGVTTERRGYLFNSMNFNLPAFEKYQEIDTQVLMVKGEVGSKVVLKNIFFDVNQSVLKTESLSELENIRDLLIRNPQWRIQINGHTDNIGHPVTNLALSLKRAESVVQYLIRQGIGPDRLVAKGYGSERPLVSNDDEAEGRQINRRTEIEIIE